MNARPIILNRIPSAVTIAILLFGHFLVPPPAADLRAEVEKQQPSTSSPQPTITALARASGRSRPFPEVILAATGHRVLPFNPDSPSDNAVITAVAAAADKALARMNSPENNPLANLRRINEASRHFEDHLRQSLDSLPDFRCEVPRTTKGRRLRSGYPDLRLVHIPSNTVTYLDPKLFQSGSRKSSLRTFYYEPSTKNGKVREDARHLLIGFEHNGENQAWTFLQWHLIDLSRISVRLKAEFQTNNRELYQPENTLRSSARHSE